METILKNGDGSMDIYLHLGFPKTGSSTLQFGLFKPLERTYNLNLLTWRKTDDSEPLDRRPSSRLFNYQKIDKEFLNFSKDKINILSDESFTAPLRLRMQNYGPNIRSPFDFPNEIKEQIETENPSEKINYKVFLTIRNQSKLIFSQYVEEYNWKLFKNIDLLFDKQGGIDIWGYDIYNFYKYILVLIDVFGKDSIKLTLFEDLYYEFEFFCKEVSEVFKLPFKDVFSSLKNYDVNAKVKTAEGVYSKGNRALVPYLTEKQNHQVMEKFYNSNLQLASMFGLYEKFKKYGYIQ